MNFPNRIHNSNQFFKAFHMVITIEPRTFKIGYDFRKIDFLKSLIFEKSNFFGLGGPRAPALARSANAGGVWGGPPLRPWGPRLPNDGLQWPYRAL